MKQWIILTGVFIGAIAAHARAEPWCGSSTPPELCKNVPAMQDPKGRGGEDTSPQRRAQATQASSSGSGNVVFDFPAPGCPKKLPTYESVSSICTALDREACDRNQLCTWSKDDLSKYSLRNCRAKIGHYLYAPPMDPADATRLGMVTADVAIAASAHSHLTKGDLYNANGKFRKAIREYTIALKEQSGLASALAGRASAYERIGDKAHAVGDFCDAVAALSGDFETYKRAKARIAQLTGQPATASPSPSGGKPLELPPSVMTPLGPQVAEQAARECSKQADARGLHGIERRNFRAQCKAEFHGSVPSAADVPQLRPVNPPQTGAIERGRRRNAIAPLAIETESGTNYLIKLVRVENKKDFILIFVKGGEEYSTKVPLGTYNIRAAAGLIWYGHKDFFGPSTHFFRMQNKDGKNPTFIFNRQGNIVHGMKFSLRKVAEGNMEEEPISRDEF